MNARNTVTLIGYFPNQEKLGKSAMYKEGSDGKKSFMRSKISVKRAFKDKDGNNRYDYITFKAFGAQADFLHNYADQEGNDIIAITGELQVDDNYENDSGEIVYGQPFVMVDSAQIISSGSSAPQEKNDTPIEKPSAKSAIARMREKKRNVVS